MSIIAAIDFESYTWSLSIPSRRVQVGMESIVSARALDANNGHRRAPLERLLAPF